MVEITKCLIPDGHVWITGYPVSIVYLTCRQCEDTHKPHTFHNEFEDTNTYKRCRSLTIGLYGLPQKNRQDEALVLLLSGLFICHVVVLGWLALAVSVAVVVVVAVAVAVNIVIVLVILVSVVDVVDSVYCCHGGCGVVVACVIGNDWIVGFSEGYVQESCKGSKLNAQILSTTSWSNKQGMETDVAILSPSPPSLYPAILKLEERF